MEQIIYDSLVRAQEHFDDIETPEQLAKYIADELKRAIADQLMQQLNHL